MPVAPAFIQRSDVVVEPVERSETIPSAWYTESDMIRIEQEAIFSKKWQLVGHISQLQGAGSSICTTVAGNPILLFNDGKSIRAFYNVCKHRGGPLQVKHGTRSVLQCQYHGWTYAADGSLRGVPHFNYVELFDKKDFGLVPVRLEYWQGLMFVNLDNDSESLSEIMQGISDRISPIDLTSFKFHKRTVDEISCNWKVYADNFLEGYHIPIVHPELARLLDYSNYVTETFEHYSLQHSPFADTSSDNPYQAEEGQAWYYFIYPNIMLNILPGRLQTNIIEPTGAESCRVIFDFYYQDVHAAVQSGLAASDADYSALIQQEDIEICEKVQMGLRSRAYDRGRFSVERESGVWHFQSKIKNSLASYYNWS